MPCTYTGSLSGDSILSLTETVKELRQDNDDLTQMLCALISNYEKNNGPQGTRLYLQNSANLADLDSELIVAWWSKHKQSDEARKIDQQIAELLERKKQLEKSL